MIQSTAYCLSGAENSKLVISHDELRVLFNQIESEFCQSDIYQKAFNGLQKRLGNAPKWIHPLIKAVGREAIRLTLRQIICQYHNEQYQREQCDGEQRQPSQISSHRDQNVETKAATSDLSSSGVNSGDSSKKGAAVKTKIPVKQVLVSENSASARAANLQVRQDTRQSFGANSQVTPKDPEPKTNDNQPSRAIAPSSVTSNHKSVAETVSGQVMAHATPMSAHQKSLENGLDSSSESHWRQAPNHNDTPKATSSTRKRAHTVTAQTGVEQVFRDSGATLKKARLEQSLTIREIHERTRVALHQIEAIEAGNLDRLPEEIYVKGFIRQIALVVGLDYSTLIERLPQTTLKTNVVPHWHINNSSISSKQNSFRPAHLYIGYAALMASAAGGLVWVNQSQSAAQLDSLDMPFDIPQIIDDITSILPFDHKAQHRSQAQSGSILPGAIANPEIVTVESSISR